MTCNDCGMTVGWDCTCNPDGADQILSGGPGPWLTLAFMPTPAGEHEADAQLIACAPEDIRLLLAEVEQLRGECTRLAVGHDEYNRVNQILAEENERLREALEPLAAYVERPLVGSYGGDPYSPLFRFAVARKDLDRARAVLSPPETPP